MAKDENKEKAVYVVNNSFISHEILGIVFPRQHFVAISSNKLEELKKVGVFNELLKHNTLVLKDEIDDSMRTTEEQLAISKTELIKAKEEQEALKNEALFEIEKRDKRIAELEAQLKEKGVGYYERDQKRDP